MVGFHAELSPVRPALINHGSVPATPEEPTMPSNGFNYFNCSDGNLLSPLDVVGVLSRLKVVLSLETVGYLVEPNQYGIRPEYHAKLLKQMNSLARRALDSETYFIETSQQIPALE